MKLTPYQAYKQNLPKELYKTLKQLSSETGLGKKLLNKRSWKLGLKGICLGKDSTKYYTEVQVKNILNYLPPPKRTSSVKISIIELFQQGVKGRDIAKNMKLSTVLAYDSIREYNKTGCITVESKLNHLEV